MSAFDTKRTLNQCLLLGVKRTLPEPAPMSAFGPKRTLASQNCCDATSSLNPISQNGQPRKSSRTDGDNRQLDLGASSPLLTFAVIARTATSVSQSVVLFAGR